MEEEANRRAFGERAYAMKKHDATHLHYDLRLKWNDVLLSWALPEGPSCRAGICREAIEMENHNSAYLLFEGVHKTGTIMLWDRGTWEPHPEFEDIEKSLRMGILRFTLRGEKLKGGWTLARINTAKNQSHAVWTLSKYADAFAQSRSDKCILMERPNSISTGRTMDEIERDWFSPKNKHLHQMKLFDAA